MPSTKQSAAPFVPADRTPCLFYAKPYRTVGAVSLFATPSLWRVGDRSHGERPKVAVMMIGEQPGDHEDKRGRPFVGPAGKLLDKCSEEVEIDRRKIYVTKTVKNSKWEPRGKLRVNKGPSMKEIHAFRTMARSRVRDRPSYATSLSGCCDRSILIWLQLQNYADARASYRKTKVFNLFIETLHPSAILRAHTKEDRHSQRKFFVQDLQKVAKFVSRCFLDCNIFIS
jgi:uracil-DNA glycosylase family 4